jgi:hypothetical protein
VSYKLQTQRIIPGGLNLLAPGDQVAEGDCLDLADWWPGAAGRLEQAPEVAQANLPTVTSAQDSLCQADGRIYYGGGGNLRQIGRAAEAAIDTGYDSTPLGMISYQGYCWIMNRSKQRKDDGTTVSDWTPAPPGVPTLTDGGVDGAALVPAVGNPPEVGGLPNEALYYYVTWQYGTLGESNPSTVATVITPATITPAVAGSIVRITMPTPPATATGWHIYRKVSSTVYRLNEGVIDIARTYVDDYGDEIHTHSDTKLLQLGIIMEGDHDAAPAARVIADQVYNGRILVASSAAHPNRIWWTPALQPGFFRAAANPNEGDWVDCGTDSGDAVLAMVCHPNMTVIYRQRSIWRNVGDFGAGNGGRLEVVVPDIGTVGVRGVVATSLGDYFIASDGVYRFSDWAQKVSQKVDPVFRGLATENLPTLGTAYRSQMAIGYKNGRLWVSYPNSAGAMAHSLVGHIETQRWFNNPIGYGAFLDTGTAFLGAGPGVFSLESTYGGGTVLGFQSEYQDCGKPDHQKTFADLVVIHNTQGITLTVKVRKDRNVFPTVAGVPTDEFTLTTITSTVLTREVIPLVSPLTYAAGHPELGTPIKARNLSIRITGNGAPTTPIVIETPMLLHYYEEAREAKSFDSDETDHGIPEVKTVDQVEFDIDSPNAGALLQVYSDKPGGAVVAREGSGQAIPQTVGRQAQRIVLTAPADGRLLRYTVTDPNTHKIYGVRARVLPIGEYLDGTVGEFWQPQPIGIGV